MNNMEKIKSIILIVLSVITVIVIGVGVTLRFRKPADGKLFGIKVGQNWGSTVVDTINLDGDIEDVVVDMNIAAVEFEYGEKISVSYELPEKLVPKVELSGGQLSIKNINKVVSGFDDLKNITSDDYKVTITIPEGTELQIVDIKVDCGDLEINDIKVVDFTVSGDCGNIEVDNLTADTCEIHADLGNIELDKIQCKNMNLSADCGNLEVSDSSMEEINVVCSMGNIELTRVDFEEGDFDNDMGDIKVDGDFSVITADCSLGSIKIDTNKDITDVKLNLNVDLGDIEVNGQKWNKTY